MARAVWCAYEVSNWQWSPTLLGIIDATLLVRVDVLSLRCCSSACAVLVRVECWGGGEGRAECKEMKEWDPACLQGSGAAVCRWYDLRAGTGGKGSAEITCSDFVCFR